MKGLRKIPLREMARRVGISASYLNDIEKGKRVPSVEVYTRLLNEYGEGLNDWFQVVTVQKVVPKWY